VANPTWNIMVQKTGYIAEAGKCLVMEAVIEGRNVVIVLLDSLGKYTRVADAKRVKSWMESTRIDALGALARPPEPRATVQGDPSHSGPLEAHRRSRPINGTPPHGERRRPHSRSRVEIVADIDQYNPGN
jgi:D-alanyl-D-alanine carboxypeptidase